MSRSSTIGDHIRKFPSQLLVPICIKKVTEEEIEKSRKERGDMRRGLRPSNMA